MFVLSKQLCMNMESSCLISSRHYHLRPFGKYLRGKSKANFQLRKKGKHVKHNAHKGRSAWTDSNCVLISHEFTFIFMAMRCMYIWRINGERNNHKFDSCKAISPFHSRWKLTAFHDCEHFNRKKLMDKFFCVASINMNFILPESIFSLWLEHSEYIFTVMILQRT